MTLYLGIDPGAVSGAYAVITDMADLVDCDDLPTISSGTLRWIDGPAFLSRILSHKAGQPMVAMVERQGARPGQGLSSTFTSATAFGSLLATLHIAGCGIELTTAASWKAAIGGLSKDKCASLDRARLMYPDAPLDRKKDHGRAESILIARYGLMRRAGA